MVGTIIEKYGVKYRLISFIRETITTESRTINGRRYIQDIVHNKYVHNKKYEAQLWLTERVSDGMQYVLTIDVEVSKQQSGFYDDCSLYERNEGEYPDNTMEVNLLLDSYEEFIHNLRDTRKDSLLTIKRQKSQELLQFLRDEAAKPYKSGEIKTGFKLRYIQRGHPTWIGYKILKQWNEDNPEACQKINEKIDVWLKQKEGRNTESSI